MARRAALLHAAVAAYRCPGCLLYSGVSCHDSCMSRHTGFARREGGLSAYLMSQSLTEQELYEQET